MLAASPVQLSSVPTAALRRPLGERYLDASHACENRLCVLRRSHVRYSRSCNASLFTATLFFKRRVAFAVDTCGSQCYKAAKTSPLVVSLLSQSIQRVRPQTCLAGQACRTAQGIVV